MLSLVKYTVLLVYIFCSSNLQGKENCCSAKPLEGHTINPEERYPRLLVFVSFSMPMATLKQLSLQAQEVGGKLVFRGLVNHSFKETMPKLKELGAEVLIDPTLFRTYKITQVPAFVLQDRSPSYPGEEVRHDILYGNVSLHYALAQFAENGEIKEKGESQ